MSIPLPKKTKRVIKGQLKSLHMRYVRWRYAFNTDQLRIFLHDLGLKNGDVVLVHSSYNKFEGYTGKPMEVIEAIQDIVGQEGTLLMPTMPFSGTAIDYIRSGKPFDVRRSPSRMGLLTELFRRMPDVVRSVHPTHPVAAWGALAQSMIADHHLCNTPCGRQSPFGKLLDHNGRILFLGTGIGVLTFLHTLEEILEPDMPFSAFTDEVFNLASTTGSGAALNTQSRLFDTSVSRKRNPSRLMPELKKSGCWREARIGNLDAILLEAQDVLETARSMAERGIYCYDD